MDVIKHILSIGDKVIHFKNLGKSIGFVPTMGALHNGHISLIKRAKFENDIVIASIFVNPIQFNNKEDLQKYPRTLSEDVCLLQESGCDLVFTPTENEMYPSPDNRTFNFDSLDTLLEGKFRPGHFNGVAIIVSKLFEILKPDKAYFGEKDFQQLLIIKTMVKKMNLSVEIIPCTTIREADGLAMSSRNLLLASEDRVNAGMIYQTLIKAKELSKTQTIAEVKGFTIKKINSIPNFSVEYFEIINSLNLREITNWEDTEDKIGCIAAYAGKIRLIDNLKF